MKQSPSGGFAAVAALFLVVVLAALGAFMVSFSNTQQLTSAQDLQGSQAYWAARNGLEWGIGRVMACASPSGSVCSGSPPSCPTSPTILPNFDGGISVTLSCTRTDYSEGASPTPPNIFIYRFTADAATTGSPGSIGYVQRSVSAALECDKLSNTTYTCG